MTVLRLLAVVGMCGLGVLCYLLICYWGENPLAEVASARAIPRTTLAQETQAIAVPCDEKQSLTPSMNVGFMDFREVRRVHWTLVRSGPSPIQLNRVLGDCACVSIFPTEGVLSSQHPLSGYIDYRNDNLGISKRHVLFETSAGRFPLELSSAKLRDHYVIPTELHVADEHFSVEWNAVYLRSADPPHFRVSRIDTDERYLRLDHIEAGASSSRTATSAGQQLEYDEEHARLAFSVTSRCPIGKHATEICVFVGDTGGRVPDHPWRIPVWLEVRRGIEVRPAAVMWGYQAISQHQLPVRQTVAVRGLRGASISKVVVQPEAPWVAVDIRETAQDSAMLEVVIGKDVPLGKPWSAFITLTLSGHDGSNDGQIIVPVGGVFLAH